MLVSRANNPGRRCSASHAPQPTGEIKGGGGTHGLGWQYPPTTNIQGGGNFDRLIPVVVIPPVVLLVVFVGLGITVFVLVLLLLQTLLLDAHTPLLLLVLRLLVVAVVEEENVAQVPLTVDTKSLLSEYV